MTKRLSDYVALALVRGSREETFSFGAYGDEKFNGDTADLKKYVEECCGFPVSEAILAEAVRTLTLCGVMRVSNDDYAGTFVRTDSARFKSFMNDAREDLVAMEKAESEGELMLPAAVEKDFRFAMLLGKHPIFEDFEEFGAKWLDRALEALKERYPDGTLRLTASDQVINQSEEPPLIDSSAWTGLSPRYEMSEGQRQELEARLKGLEKELDILPLNNVEKSQARALVGAALLMATAPELPVDAIFEVLRKLNDIAGIAALVVTIMGLFVK